MHASVQNTRGHLFSRKRGAVLPLLGSDVVAGFLGAGRERRGLGHGDDRVGRLWRRRLRHPGAHAHQRLEAGETVQRGAQIQLCALKIKKTDQFDGHSWAVRNKYVNIDCTTKVKLTTVAVK